MYARQFSDEIFLFTGNFYPSDTVLMMVLLAISAVQTSLLLRCGDVEKNPGPGELPILYIRLIFIATINYFFTTKISRLMVYGEGINMHTNLISYVDNGYES